MTFGRIISVAIVVWLFGSGPVRAQDAADTVGSLPGIVIETSVDRAESYIGDLITYTLTITYDSSYRLTPPPLGANLGAFDVKNYQPDIETELPDGRLQSQTVFILSTYTTGDYVIPPLPVMFFLPDGSHKVMLAEPVPMKILSLLEMAGGDSLDIRPLKAQYDFPPDYSKIYLWGGIGLSVLLLAAAAVGYWLRRRRRAQAAEDLRPPWEIAFERLAFLKVEYLDNGLGEQSRAKMYYVELTETARTYLGRIYKTDVLEMTTEEFLEAFHEIALPAGCYELLATYFRHADQVKFARYQPETARVEEDFLFTHDLVEKIRVDYEKRLDAEINTPDKSHTDVFEEAQV